jgi:hypothetical protein
MEYTLCSKVIEKASLELKYAYDLLWHFIQEGPNRVAINAEILNEYLKHAENSGPIREWVNGMDYKGYWKYIPIDQSDNVFIETCKKTFDKRLIVCEKEDYDADYYIGLTVFNKDEAITELHQIGIVIIQIGNGNQATTGNNSSNTK